MTDTDITILEAEGLYLLGQPLQRRTQDRVLTVVCYGEAHAIVTIRNNRDVFHEVRLLGRETRIY